MSYLKALGSEVIPYDLPYSQDQLKQFGREFRLLELAMEVMTAPSLDLVYVQIAGQEWEVVGYIDTRFLLLHRGNEYVLIDTEDTREYGRVWYAQGAPSDDTARVQPYVLQQNDAERRLLEPWV